MIAKTYGIYDSIQQEYVQTFTCKNDEDAKRTADEIVRTPNFDDVLYKDRSLHHLFDIDTSDGHIVNNNVYQVFIFASAIEARNRERMEKMVSEKLMTDAFKEEVKTLVLNAIKGEIHNEQNPNS